ncbi:substrate-binding domain-containing protein [Pararobbsia silviterrae]|uniref:ABC transporter substrate-binding protein n=1 Tax=Pararobbsia silviterrae TaxID=1792498 RepID=A0A494XEP4_9BURK|nr:substrate-binding domain-containing protein [Pararobbsia silviterrae]RKP46614.1 ABC transporter substrate-binding protein [Pararobbsia silviterrae]
MNKRFSKRLTGAALGAGLCVGLVLGDAPAASAQTMAVSIPAADHGWTGGVVYFTNREADNLRKAYPNLKIIVKTSPSGAEQASAIEDMTSTQKIDALVVLPQNSDELTSTLANVKKKGVFITVVDRGLKDPTIQDLYVAGNNPELGRIAGEYFKKNLPEGDIVVLRGIPTVIDDQRVKAFQEAIKGTKINVLDMQYANWNRDDGFKVMQDFLAKHKHIDAVWCQDDDIAVGVLEAIKQANRTDIKFVVGGAGMKDMIKRVADGDKMIPVDVLYPPGMVATAMNITAANLTAKLPVRGTFIIGAPLVTKENAKEYYFPDSPF